MQKLFTFILLNLLCSLAHAEWTSFGRYSGAELFIDPGKIGQQAKFMSVWYYLNFDQVTQIPKQGPMQSLLYHNFYSCEQRSRAIESISNYSAKNLSGVMNFSKSAETAEFEEVPANSMDEVVLKLACSKYRR
jgi:hypothetical protein